ncbi:hypothetical protein GUJ93_ZPchr0012g21393 [Zizania palustris]|uniref:Uncharacterized protein n=1 Tax=Zizania palustris TaxID=103762 RepID=A0A8J5WTZ0_ZIZPA|nr:hypothetical protein GUJ93_ZPchr0012g21393 [Zizania palustris]
MGCAFSSARALPAFDGVRVIHINGYVESFDGLVTVGHVTRKTGGAAAEQQRYVLCSSAHLLQPGRAPFRPDDPLQPGTVYFLLPQSIFQSESSAVDLACLMNRLTALARKGGGAAAAPSPVEAVFDGLPQHHESSRGPKAEPDQPAPSGSDHRCCAPRPALWKPRLDRIDESIGRASSSSSRSAFSEA